MASFGLRTERRDIMERIVHCDNNHDDAILDLGEYAFRYKLSESERNHRKERMKQEHIIGIINGEKLASKVHLLPQYLYLGGKSIPFGGIAGVATWPEFRRKGHVRQLMNKSLEEMRSRHMPLSMLHPFDIDFYRKFGWELTQYAHTVELKPRDIPSYKTKGNVDRVKYDENKRVLHEIYERHAKRYGLMLDRNEYWWKYRVISDDDFILMSYNEKGEEDGFLLANLSKDQLTIEEWFYDSKEASQRLLSWIRNHDSMVPKVILTLAPDDPIIFYLHNPRVKEDRHAYFMSRIVDVESFFTQYPYQSHAGVTVQLDVTDEAAEWNNGSWFLSIQNEQVFITNESKEADVHVKGDIQSLTALWLNAQKVEDLLFFDRLQIEGDLEQLKALIVKETPALLDFF